MKILTAIPVYNEERHLTRVLEQVFKYTENLVIINDGSTDGTAAILQEYPQLTVLHHAGNRGYGAALITAFEHAKTEDCDILVTMDCDGQHEPARIPVLLEAMHDVDIVSGSRYLRDFRQTTLPTPEDRRYINLAITGELNEQLALNLTDAFCGFKAYNRRALRELHPTETGWGMPLEVWVQASFHGLAIGEIGVPRIYLDPNRSFGAGLDDAPRRLAYYRRVIAEAIEKERACTTLGETCAVFGS